MIIYFIAFCNAYFLMPQLVSKLIEDARHTKNVTREAGHSIRKMTKEIHCLRLEVEQLSEQALTEFRTGIGNRRAFDVRFNDLLEHSVESSKPFREVASLF